MKKIKKFLKNLFWKPCIWDLKKYIAEYRYEEVADILTRDASLVNHVFSRDVFNGYIDGYIEDYQTESYTLLDEVLDQEMIRLLRHFGAKTYDELKEEEMRLREEEKKKRKETPEDKKERERRQEAENRRQNGKAIVDKILGTN